jgi:putative flippase GtrA
VQLSTLQALTVGFGLPYVPATVLSVEAAILHNFIWHERWTWRDVAGTRRAAWPARLLRFNGLAALAGFAGNVAFTALYVEAAGMPLLLANALAVISLAAINFIVADRLVYIARPGVAPRERPA